MICYVKFLRRGDKDKCIFNLSINHVDTGKSTLCGHLLYKCGYIDERNTTELYNLFCLLIITNKTITIKIDRLLNIRFNTKSVCPNGNRNSYMSLL